MSNTLRRSPRLSQHYSSDVHSLGATVTAFTSTSTTSQPSPTTDPASIVAQQEQLRLQLQTQFLCLPAQSAGPLPSPSAADSSPYFSSAHSHSSFDMPEQNQSGNTTSSHQGQTAQGGLQNTQTSTTQHHNSFSSNQRPAMTHGLQGQSQGPPPGILAEAAKRAQMACLMRDLGDVTL